MVKTNCTDEPHDDLESAMTRAQPTGQSATSPNRKQLRRFYEPLVLLHALGMEHDEHANNTPSFEDSDSFSFSELIRQFLNELAFACDHEKGGDTDTAIGLEEIPQGYVFWVAANECPKDRIVPFLDGLLTKLRDVRGERDTLLVEEVLRFSTSFAHLRIKTYGETLLSELYKLKQFPACSDRAIFNKITSWIGTVDRIIEEDPHHLVEFAYEQQHCAFIHELGTLAREPRYKTSEDSLQAVFISVRHLTRRLGNYCRSARALVQYAPRMIDLLESSNVKAVPTPTKGLGRPPSRNGATLAAVLARIFPITDPLILERYQQALANIDRTCQVSERFKEAYGSAILKTRVHAEAQVLDHFYESNRRFAENDKYIATSKPACFCCLLYFRYHPGGFIETHSHQKVPLDWQPPGVSTDAETGRKTQLWKILDQMLGTIRATVLRQIISKAPPRDYHPDSATGISPSNLARLELDTDSVTVDGVRASSEVIANSNADASSNSDHDTATAPTADQLSWDSDNSSFSSEDSPVASPNLVQASWDGDTDQEDGGISLLNIK